MNEYRFKSVEDPVVERDEHGMALLRLTVDGHQVGVWSRDLRRPLLEAGVVYLHALGSGDWLPERDLPPLVLPAGPYPLPDSEKTLRGFTDDPRVVELVRGFVAAADLGAVDRYVGGPPPS